MTTLKTLASTATLLLTLSPLTIASAQSSVETFVFETVDSYELLSGASQLSITGILQGEAAPRTIPIPAATNNTTSYEGRVRACERMALMAMSKPGQYLFELRRFGTFQPVHGCKLTRR